MARLRIFIIFSVLWMTLIFNLERPDTLNINFSSAVYVVAALSLVVILLLPDFSHMRLGILLIPVFVIYGIARTLPVIGASDPGILTLIMEVLILLGTISLARLLSANVTNFEEVLENLVIGTSKTRVQSMAEGEQTINGELFRARRFSRPVGFVLLKLNDVEQMQINAIRSLDYQGLLQRRFMRMRAVQITESFVYTTDPMTWYNDNLVVCLPETNREEAVKFTSELSHLIKMTLNLAVPIGIASFPEDGLVLSNLITAASDNEYVPPEPVVEAHDDDDDDRGLGSSETAAAARESQEVAAAKSPTIAAFVGAVINFFTAEKFMHLSTVPAQPYQLDLPYYDPDFWVNQLPYQSAQSRVLYAKLKRAIDMLLVLLSLPFTLPVGLLVALIILIEDGRPILFAQSRTGYGGQVFKMYKFRSMIPNAEARMAELGVRVNERGETINENGEKLENDPRITRIGKLLRKTSLDELPQLWNVFAGQMSIVGPRPTSFGLKSYTLLHTQRLSVRPGITGLWQIYDRGDTDFNNRLIWDIKYIEKLSLTLDAHIVIRTFMRVLKDRGAR